MQTLGADLERQVVFCEPLGEPREGRGIEDVLPVAIAPPRSRGLPRPCSTACAGRGTLGMSLFSSPDRRLCRCCVKVAELPAEENDGEAAEASAIIGRRNEAHDVR